MQALVRRIFSNEMQRPSAVQVWQTPLTDVLPRAPALPARLLPLEEQETSYLALSARISRRCSRGIVIMRERVTQMHDRICHRTELKRKNRTCSQMERNNMIQKRQFSHTKISSVLLGLVTLDFHQSHEPGKPFQTTPRVAASQHLFRRIVGANRFHLL